MSVRTGPEFIGARADRRTSGMWASEARIWRCGRAGADFGACRNSVVGPVYAELRCGRPGWARKGRQREGALGQVACSRGDGPAGVGGRSPEVGDRPIGTRLLHEDQHCRVWLLDLAPGDATDWHVHSFEYLYVVTAAGPVECEFTNGKSIEYQSDQIGDVKFKRPDDGHRLVNRSDQHYQNIIIEFLTNKAGRS